MRPTWKGNLKISAVTIPVQIYTAHSSQKGLRFDLLHRECKSKIDEQYFCPACERVLARDELVKGFEQKDGSYIVVSDEDLQAAQKEAIQAIEVMRFVDGAQIDPIYYCHAHYLVPRGKSAVEAFALFRQAMIEEKKTALARAVIRNKEHLLAITPHHGALAVFTLHRPEDIERPEKLEDSKRVMAARIDKQNLRLARGLIQRHTADFVPEQISEEFSKTLIEIIRARSREEPVKTAIATGRGVVLSLSDALEKSLEEAEKKQRETREARKPEPKTRKKAV